MGMEERGGFWKKKVVEKVKMLNVGVFLKKTKSIFGVFLINFQKIPFFHRYIGQITCQHSILWCVFFGNLEIQF